MAASRTYETMFKIAAKFTGSPAFSAANRAIDHTEKHAVGASRKMHGMFAGVATPCRTAKSWPLVVMSSAPNKAIARARRRRIKRLGESPLPIFHFAT